ncbi:MAG: hypothetical protein CMM07_26680 [Rhodopirellula sp.]|nr:hypothetical protein [Rhodopirellula sp.]
MCYNQREWRCDVILFITRIASSFSLNLFLEPILECHEQRMAQVETAVLTIASIQYQAEQ